MADEETVTVELLIRIDGAADINRIAVFELPIVAREVDGDNNPTVKFESKVLIQRIIKALKRRT